MASLALVLATTYSIFFTPFLMTVLCIIFLASIGKSLGVRKLYVKLLLVIFEYGRANIETAQKKRYEDEDTEDEEEESHTEPENAELKSDNTTSGDRGAESTDKHESENSVANSDSNLKITSTPSKKKNGVVNGSSQLISRENLILTPDPVQNYLNAGDTHEPSILYSLDLLKAGMEAIIEDQVTSRFQTEELKNWNLLTRTNRNYEFISWKLTVMWACGFFVRHFFLFPIRFIICWIGVSWMVLGSLVISVLPTGSVKRWLNDLLFLSSFRIFMRSLSAVLRFHNKEHQPKRNGLCVANHTTVIDVIVLSCATSFSLVMWLTLCTALVGYVPESDFKTWLNRKVSIMCFGFLSTAVSSDINYHNPENRPNKSGICVANHTSPIDVLVLMCDNCYSLIGQRHGGFLGILQRALARASPHIWFERSEVKDRAAVTKRLKEHISNPKNPPILIFPEGTCINNTSVMQFKKGSFEVGGVIYPVAIKYDPRFGDAFWNSSKYSMLQYLYMMMTSWAIVCDVWYLPPMYQEEGESAIDFANRVKSVIAKQGGLVDLMWDGQLKRTRPKKELKELQQQELSRRFKLEKKM